MLTLIQIHALVDSKLFGHPGIDRVRIHLLTLQDVFLESGAYRDALADLPTLSVLPTVVDLSVSPASARPQGE